MLKLLLGIAVVVFTTLCGYIFSKKYRQRRQFFAQLCEFNERFLSEIAYYRRPIADFLTTYTYKDEFNELLTEYYTSLKKAGEGSHLIDFSRFSFLKEAEDTVLNDYFLMLGKGDSSSQTTYFSSVKGTLAEYQATAAAEAKKYGDLYVKIGFLCGLFILILII